MERTRTVAILEIITAMAVVVLLMYLVFGPSD
jgi:hypothetical protein